MPMYAITAIPHIRKVDGNVKQVCYTGDVLVVGSVSQLREWWDKLSTIDPKCGYFANVMKMWLVTKKAHLAGATTAITDTGLKVTCKGRPYLGLVMAQKNTLYISVTESKAQVWLTCLKNLALVALTQLHATFSALTHGLVNKWTYTCQTTPGICVQMLPVDKVLRSEDISALTGRPLLNHLERDLFALPVRLGGLGIEIPSKRAEKDYSASIRICI